jgi:hypothetical protein
MNQHFLRAKLNDLPPWRRRFRAAVLGGLLFLGLLLAAAGVGFAAASDAPTTQWSQTYGGTGYDGAKCVIQTSDGGYAIAGHTYLGDESDFLLVKTDEAGTTQWSQTYGGTGYEYAWGVVETSDGGYAIAGYTCTSGPTTEIDLLLVKTDSLGTVQWSQTYGGTKGDLAYCVIQTSDGGYAIAGTTNSFGDINSYDYDFWWVKTDASGTVQWTQTYGGTYNDEAYCIVETIDGGYAITGGTYVPGAGDDFLFIKTDASGTIQWTQTYGGTDDDEAQWIIQTSDGGYAIAGETFSFGVGDGDFWLVKTDASGDILWSQTYGGTESEGARCVVETTDGGYALIGTTWSFGMGSRDFLLVKMDALGTVQWTHTYGGTGNDRAECLIQTNDGGYALSGTTESFGAGLGDFWLIKTAPDPLFGFGGFVLPEYSFGAMGALTACIAAMAATVEIRKRKKPTN